MGFPMITPLYQLFSTFFGRFHTFNSHLEIFNLDHKNHAKIIFMGCLGFHMKIPLYQQFYTFLGRFHPFISHLEIFNLGHENHLIECYKNT